MNNALSVIIPMYNEVENVEPLLLEVQQALADFLPYEIIVVDDGSNDGTWQQLQRLTAIIEQLRPIRHQKNYGQSAGIYTGVRAAKYPWIATLDGDGQNDPSDIKTMFAAVTDLTQSQRLILLVGNRNKRQDSWLRLLSSRIANGVRTALLKDDCPDTGCGLKIFQREAFLLLPHFNHIHRFLPALFRRAGGQVINLPVRHRPRMLGRSKYGVMNRLWVGIVDIFGVFWLIRRPCRPEVEDGF